MALSALDPLPYECLEPGDLPRSPAWPEGLNHCYAVAPFDGVA